VCAVRLLMWFILISVEHHSMPLLRTFRGKSANPTKKAILP
jgi:hypothetical protein